LQSISLACPSKQFQERYRSEFDYELILIRVQVIIEAEPGSYFSYSYSSRFPLTPLSWYKQA